MLQHAPYMITDQDWWATRTDSPRPSPQAGRLASDLAEQFGTEASFDPDNTLFAVEVMLYAAEHLTDVMPYARATIADVAHMARLLLGLNLATAHLAQLLPRLADQIDTDTGPQLTGLPEPARHRIVKKLKTATVLTITCGGATRDGGWRRPLLLGQPGLIAGSQRQRSRTTRDLLLLP
jgi:hypothetical protein